MRKTILTILLLWAAAVSLPAQDFKLYFANNVTDVLNLGSIEEIESGLNWREVKNKELAGNVVEVDQVKQMFASEDVKYKQQQRQFWRMRDHCLLCFRIDDDTNGARSYQVEVEDTIGRPKSITVSRFFFLNVMRQDNPISIRVWDTDDKQNVIAFKYYVADWDDRNLYTFQLDSKRQVENESYSLQYRLGYTDPEGEYHVETHQLALRDSAFQSFYVPEDYNLVDVMLMSGQHKLRLDKTRLHPGVTLDPDFERTVLSTRFVLDKHENRELVNFNWVGSGLYERYDTLYLGLFNEEGSVISKATIHVDPVDEYGNSTGIKEVKYLGYDRKKKVHRILTFGNPAYVEILVDGYYPVVYRYAGAADKDGVVDLERCSDNVTLFADTFEDGKIGVSSQHLYALNDTKTVEARGGTDYSICNLIDYDLSTNVQADTITDMEDAGNTWPKLLDGSEVQRLAAVELAYSSVNAEDSYSVRLVAKNVDTDEEYLSSWPEITGIYARSHPGFTRDYYFAKFNLVGLIPCNTMCELRLESNGNTYDKFPYLRNLSIDRTAVKKAGEDYTKNDVLASTDKEKVADAYAEHGCSFNFPMTFKLNLGPLFKIKTSMVYDMKKQKLTSTTTLTYRRQDGGGEDPKITEMRQEAQEFIDNSSASGHNWYESSGGLKYNNVGNTRKFDQWFSQEMDDICSIDYNNIGTGFFGSGKLQFSLKLDKLFSTGKPSEALSLDEFSGTFGYGMCLASPSLLDKYWSSGPVATLLKKIPMFGIGGVFEASVQADLGVRTFNADYPSSWDNFGFFFTLSGKVRAGLWAELCIPSNPIFSANLGLRGGGKIGIMGGIATPFQNDRFCYGLYAMSGMGIEAYASIRTFGFQWAGRAGVQLAARLYVPDNGHNPFHDDFPYWLTDGNNVKTVADSYRRLPPLEPNDFGQTLVADVASDANPHFIDSDHVVYNDLADPDDYNDDCVMLKDVNDGTVTALSDGNLNATRHMRSKRGEYEVVVFEQLGRQIDPEEMRSELALSKTNELAARTRIVSMMRKQGEAWQRYSITMDDGHVDTKPVVTIQDDGKAACIWQHGDISMDSDADATDVDSVYSCALQGQLMLSIFDGRSWSEPITLHNLSRDLVATEYDLIMRGDTVLVGTNLDSYPLDSARHTRRFVYSSVDVASKRLFQKNETLRPAHFFMNRVGQHSVIAILYEKNDSTRDVYVKTLSMNGYADGLMGNDIGANYSSPARVKIICDRAARDQSDFAILWTEVSNNAHGEEGKESFTENPRTLLNASRISLQPAPFVTVPLTLGAERDGLVITDFDGVLDDSHVKVVYTLADLESGAATIMTNERFFTNSFDYEVGYSSLALLGSTTLPVAVQVSNTGTSSIRSVTATINGLDFRIPDSYVAPMQTRTFVVQYPLDDTFDGYITNSVSVEYNNAFRAQSHPRRKAQSFLRQTKQQEVPDHVDLENIELRLVRHGVEEETNYYVVELIDHSLYGLKPNNKIKVGLYPHPSIIVPLADEAVATLTADDFEDYGGVRKAYATVRISGIKMQANAYLTTHMYDDVAQVDNPTDADIARAHVRNYRGSENAHYVALLPHKDPTAIRAIRAEGGKNVRIKLQTAEGGIHVSGLRPGDHLRVFNSSGILVFSKKYDGPERFVPLQHHDVYLISTGEEVVKFGY